MHETRILANVFRGQYLVAAFAKFFTRQLSCRPITLALLSRIQSCTGILQACGAFATPLVLDCCPKSIGVRLKIKSFVGRASACLLLRPRRYLFTAKIQQRPNSFEIATFASHITSVNRSCGVASARGACEPRDTRRRSSRRSPGPLPQTAFPSVPSRSPRRPDRPGTH